MFSTDPPTPYFIEICSVVSQLQGLDRQMHLLCAIIQSTQKDISL